MRIRLKILAIAVAILILAIMAEAVTCGYIFTKEYSKALQSRALALGENLRSQLDRIFSLGIPIQELVGFEKQCQELVERNQGIAYALVVDVKGRVLFRSDPVPRGAKPELRPGVPDTTGTESPGFWSPGKETDHDVAVPVFNSQDEQIATIHIGIEAEGIHEKISYLIKYSALVSFLALCFALALLLFALNRWVAEPLGELFGAIRQLRRDERGFYSAIHVGSGDEIGQVCSALNSLVEDLNSSHKLIADHTDKLELIVDQRTTELKALNEQLSRDIAERRKIEDALRESEARYRELSQEFHTLLDTIPDAIGLYAPDFTTIWVNRCAAEKMIGGGVSEARGEHCYRAWHNRSTPCEVCAVRKCLETGEPSSEILQGADGRVTDVRAVPLRDGEGRIVSVMEIGRDVTEQRKLENQLRQSQKLEAIGTIAGGIAHDFNNILAAIMGYTDLALCDLPDHDPVRPVLDQVLQASQRAKKLVSQILAFSRHEDGQQKGAIDLVPLIEESLSFLRASLPTTIEIQRYISCRSSVVFANSTQMQQVILNLCTNAAHAMEEQGGRLEMSLWDLELEGESSAYYRDLKPGSYLRITVSDTGHGMEKTILERIFDPYFTTKDIGKGSGLGLAVVHGIVKRHGGMIKVYSEPGKGSTFHIILPKADLEPGEERAKDAPIPLGHAERILFVDDEPSIADLAEKMLASLGYRVVATTSSIEALDRFRNGPDQFDLVVTDYTMPCLTGEGLAGEVMRIRPDIPVVLCTGFNERVRKERTETLGIREFVMKPLTRRDLGEVVRRALDGRA